MRFVILVLGLIASVGYADDYWIRIPRVAVRTCLYNQDCPKGNECLVDTSGHGYCVANLPRTDIANPMNGGLGSWCTFTADCDAGLVCIKKKINDYGVCTKEVSR